MSRRALFLIAGPLAVAASFGTPTARSRAAELAYPEQKLVGSDATADAQFGHNVTIDGDYLIAGAPTDSNFGQYSGAAYVFRRSGSAWIEDAVLRTPVPAGGERFGHAVDLSGGTAVVSTLDDAAGDGAVYVFERGAVAWSLVRTLRAPVPTPGHQFGASVEIDGDTIAVSEQNAGAGGVVHIYDRQPAGWTYSQTVSGAAVSADDFFGRDLALEDAALVVGALGDDSARPNSGAVYEFRRRDGTWTETARLLAADFGVAAGFGTNVAISGNSLAITGSLPQPGDTRTMGVVILERNADGWAHTASVVPLGVEQGQTFWGTISLHGDILLAGTHTPDLLGAATVVERGTEGWAATQLLRASDGQAVSLYGRFVAIDERTAVVSALRNLSDAVDTGAVYVYEGLGPEPVSHGFLLPSRVRLRVPKARAGGKRAAAQLKSKGAIDFGPTTVDLTGPLELQVGSRAFQLPGLVTDGRGFVYSYDDGTVSLTIKTSKAGGSRASYALAVRGDLSDVTTLDGPLRLSLRVGGTVVTSEVALARGRHNSNSQDARWSEPKCALTALNARVSASGPDRVSLRLRRPPSAAPAPISEPVVVSIGSSFRVEIPASSFARRGTKDVFRGNIRGVRQVVVDQMRGRIRIVARNAELGSTFGAAEPQEFSVRLHGQTHGNVVRLAPAGRALRY